ncbi:hypothetical protein MADA3029_p0029 [Vibrio nigripulchritudo MADA3029]|uniref:SMI1/KNR4 family protein n=1 Tax=Vibrio nigripulchritudo TaxID=28173 RepID=UPI0003B1D03C|nr:SMI1/KNR4 family protein [Vibrio nigripulchritudo]CCN50803.1 hypothetical protein VIBNIMADA3020_p0029 [Vibrio nigripulchritudo MADA3020]CCN56661.1 hypothetical protein VIBNIMADA3021_p0029 [Vibrio nigripulchritudo MADA3021]CCN62518.1 hypothetical protein MADA3029_p0029 [Vibrio nigripulchritudo MADA3029]
MERSSLECLYKLNPGVDPARLEKREKDSTFDIPKPYLEFLKLSDGLYTGQELVLLELADIEVRNNDYEVQAYLPGHIMIGDDSGGTALVMKLDESGVYEVDMGVMDIGEMEKSADSLAQLLIQFEGKMLSERNENQ